MKTILKTAGKAICSGRSGVGLGSHAGVALAAALPGSPAKMGTQEEGRVPALLLVGQSDGAPGC